MKRKYFLFILLVVLFLSLFLTPLYWLKYEFNIKTEIQKSNKLTILNTEGSSTRKGLCFNCSQGYNTENVKVINSTVLNFGLYTYIKKDFETHKIVNQDTFYSKTSCDVHIWGLGNMNIKKNILDELVSMEINK